MTPYSNRNTMDLSRHFDEVRILSGDLLGRDKYPLECLNATKTTYSSTSGGLSTSIVAFDWKTNNVLSHLPLRFAADVKLIHYKIHSPVSIDVPYLTDCVQILSRLPPNVKFKFAHETNWDTNMNIFITV